ncbi:hypothetical protein DESUT3_13200 [Desulfuromonas versatilis]|uniref:Protein translocase subunit SecA n=1 Tax=Desulfuromonas versatilis TaxID=2802975 RepID=A0ABN6DW73_9BACT|nr:prepilin peptidase [Desulfuromonas versatilis]BCR04251.1 hypothetical protein DESUT3_13200 [Desulfuromonas versatilis]
MMLPARDYHATRIATPGKLPKGLDRWAHDALGRLRGGGRTLQRYREQAEQIVARSLQQRLLSERRLREELQQMQAHFRRRQKGYEAQLPEALALLAESAERTLGMRPYPVQVLGALAIHHGCLAEMATGEGKTLTACFPAILAAWSGRPCHVVTANDYLASRDAGIMAPLYRFAGLSAGWVGGEMEPAERRSNYARGVVYTTSKELLADFLRDRLQPGLCSDAARRQLRRLLDPRAVQNDARVMRGLDTAIIDEADSVLIDEAVTPLIISATQENRALTETSLLAQRIADSLVPGEHYRSEERYHEIRLTEAGRARLGAAAEELPGLWRGEARREELVLTALSAREFYRRGKQYVVEEGKVVIVDEFTGRLMPQRTWRQGLHQAIEAREGLALSDPSETLARLSFQRFFRFFRHLGGMTGTAREAAGEFWHIYNLPVLAVPTHKPCIREILPSRVYADRQSKWRAIADEVLECHRAGRPVLVGTRSIAASEELAAMLSGQGVPCQLLNAVRHREEAQIIAGAGQRGAVTIATNMAGRGTDIHLGRGVAELGGLHVIVSERHEAGRIDRQLIGRCSRQGEPGSARSYISMDDELLRRFAPRPARRLLARALAENRPGAAALVEKTLALAQQAAQRLAFRQRETVLQTDDWLSDALSFARSEVEG